MLKELKELHGYYIDSEGKVYNSRNVQLRTYIINSGYESIKIKGKHFLIHRLVAKYFCKGYKEGLVVNHIDGNRLNNNCSNLEWCTPSDNMKDVVSKGRSNLESIREHVGELHKVPVCQYDKDTGQFIKEYASISEASKATGCLTGEISMVCSQKVDSRGYTKKTSRGYIWKYKYSGGINQSKLIKIEKDSIIYSFNSYSKAAEFIGCSPSYLSHLIKDKKHGVQNYNLIY